MKPLLPFGVGERPVLVSHALCPYVQRASIVLAEKGVAFERIDIDLAHKPAWFSALSPLGKTPMLLVREGEGVQPLFESAVICDYLDETHAPALHPPTALGRARHRGWVEVASATLNTVWQLYTAADEVAFEAARRVLRQRFAQLEAELAARHAPGGAPWFAGAAFSIVDAAFAPVFRYFEVIDGITDTGVFDNLPLLADWRRALAQRASVRAAVGTAYPAQLRAFFVRQGGVLGRRAVAATETPNAAV